MGNLTSTLRDCNAIAGLAAALPQAGGVSNMLQRSAELANALEDAATRNAVIAKLGVAVLVEEHQIGIRIDISAIMDGGVADNEDAQHHSIIVPVRLTRRGQELRLAYPPGDARAPAEPDVKLVGLIAKAEAAHQELLADPSIERVRRGHLTRLARLKYLAPDIVSAILNGCHPVELSARKLLRAETIPLDWREQRRALGFG